MRILLLALLGTALICSVQGLPDPFTVTISTEAEIKIGENVTCKVTITNNHNHEYHLLKRRTPLEGLMSSIFTVTHNGKMLPYEGLHFKRAPPTDDDYVSIPAKSSLEATVDLSLAYRFQASGEYSVQLSTTLNYFHGCATTFPKQQQQQVSSNIQVFMLMESSMQPKMTEAQIIGMNFPSKPLSQLVGDAKPPKFSGNWPDVAKNESIQAYYEAYKLVKESVLNVFNNLTLYRTWFGDAQYQDQVSCVYTGIKSSLEKEPVTLVDEGILCKNNTYAYSLFQVQIIFFCPLYMASPAYEKAGVIVHEMTHIVDGTNDIVYGREDARALARECPDLAIRNADNYEYFSLKYN